MKKGRKIHKPLNLWSPFSTKGIIFKWTWHPAPLGHWDFIPSHATGARSLFHPSPIVRGATGDLFFFFFFPPLHCYSSAICLWRSTVWRRAWEEKSQSDGRDEMRCDGLACRGKEGTMQIKYARPIRNRQMRWPCCYGNTPSAVEYWVWLWYKCYKIWTGFDPKPPDTGSFGMYAFFFVSLLCACHTLICCFLHRFTILAVKYWSSG